MLKEETRPNGVVRRQVVSRVSLAIYINHVLLIYSSSSLYPWSISAWALSTIHRRHAGNAQKAAEF